MFSKNIVLNKNWFVVSIYREFLEKIMFWSLLFPTKNKSQTDYFQKVLVTKYLHYTKNEVFR